MKYGCIGETLKHSFSKEIHTLLSDEPYELTEISKEELAEFFKKKEFEAINVTIPYKTAILPFLDEVSAEAKEIGAVNTVINRSGVLVGENTDVFGMQALLSRLHANPAGRKVAILGSGGTSLTAAYVVKKMGGEPIRVSRSGKENCISYAELSVNFRGICGIINTTPVGMYPHASDALLVDLSVFPHLEFVADAVYHPLRTNLILEAAKRKIPCEGGLYMLVAQAVRASELFRACTYPEGTCQKVFETLTAKKENIVLVGMPGVGKTTVGRVLANLTGRVFADLDSEIQKATGKSIPKIFEEYGEEGFRKLERKMIEKASELCGYVLATGGGAILDETNVNAMRRNGKIFFLDRPLEDLVPTQDRPLSQNAESLKSLYETRYPLYCKVADFRISSFQSPETAAKMIAKEFYHQ